MKESFRQEKKLFSKNFQSFEIIFFFLKTVHHYKLLEKIEKKKVTEKRDQNHS